MKLFISLILFILLASCSTQPQPVRSTASTNCYESIKVEYNSYFDSYEKCLEKSEKK